MTTRIGIERIRGHLRYDLRSDALAPRVLPAIDGRARIALVAARALLLAGDAVDLEVVIGGGVSAEIVETSGTVAYDPRGGRAWWNVRVAVHESGHLIWRGLPFVVSAGADVARSSTIEVAAGATARVRETLVFGRTGETGGSLRSRTHVELADDVLLAETLDLTPAARQRPGVLAGFRCLDTLLTAGDRLMPGDVPGVAEHQLLQLDGSGTLVRFVGQNQHESPLEAWR